MAFGFDEDRVQEVPRLIKRLRVACLGQRQQVRLLVGQPGRQQVAVGILVHPESIPLRLFRPLHIAANRIRAAFISVAAAVGGALRGSVALTKGRGVGFAPLVSSGASLAPEASATMTSIASPPAIGPVAACRLDLSHLPLRFLGMRASCGFPSPAEDFMGEDLDLNELCIRNPPATFFAQAEGDSMRGFGIHAGDMLVVDRSINAKSGHIALLLWDGGLCVKQLRIGRSCVELLSGDGSPPLAVADEVELQVWGVVTYSFRNHLGR